MTSILGHPYTLTLTQSEYTALQWMADRGYDGRAHTEVDIVEENAEGVCLHYTEASAWLLCCSREDDPDAFGACASPELLTKLHNLLDEIV